MSRIVDTDTHNRAAAALARAAERNGEIFQQPASGLTEWGDGNTLVLHNSRGEVGRVRVYADGRMTAL